MLKGINRGVLLALLLLVVEYPALGFQAREYSYRFENQRFDVSMIEINLHESGEGEMRYKKRDEDNDITLQFKLQPGTMQRISELFNSARFLDSADSYQADKELPHLGKVTLGMKVSGKERETS